MKPCFHNLFVTPTTHQPLAYHGSFKEEHWVDGVLGTMDGEVEYTVIDGIPSFVSDEDDPWGDDEQVRLLLEQEEIDPDRFIQLNWESVLNQSDMMERYGQQARLVAKEKGVVLEIGCGPGGGLAPFILQYNPTAVILMNDLGFWILKKSREYCRLKKLCRHLSFAQFDATNMPLKSNSFDVVDSFGGLSAIDNTVAAFHEIYRVLRPGGKLYFIDGVVDNREFSNLPSDVQKEWVDRLPYIKNGYQAWLSDAGYRLESVVEANRRPLKIHDTPLAKVAAEYGTTLHLDLVAGVATKLP